MCHHNPSHHILPTSEPQVNPQPPSPPIHQLVSYHLHHDPSLPLPVQPTSYIKHNRRLSHQAITSPAHLTCSTHISPGLSPGILLRVTSECHHLASSSHTHQLDRHTLPHLGRFNMSLLLSQSVNQLSFWSPRHVVASPPRLG